MFSPRRSVSTVLVFALFAVAGLLGTPVQASAQGAITDKTFSETVFGGQLDIGIFTEDDTGDAGNILRADLWGNVSFGDWAVYVSLPINALTGTEGDDISSVGNLDLGGVYVVDLQVIDLLLRLGLALPTAPDDDLDEIIVTGLAVYADPTDLIQHVPETLGIRSAISIVTDIPFVDLRADVGIDGAISLDDDVVEDAMFLRINLGAAVGLGPVEVITELANFKNVTSDNTDWLHAFHAGLAFDAIVVRPRIGVTLPFSDQLTVGDILFVSLAVDVTAFQ